MSNMSLSFNVDSTPQALASEIALLKGAFIVLALSLSNDSTQQVIDALLSGDQDNIRALGRQLESAFHTRNETH